LSNLNKISIECIKLGKVYWCFPTTLQRQSPRTVCMSFWSLANCFKLNKIRNTNAKLKMNTWTCLQSVAITTLYNVRLLTFPDPNRCPHHHGCRIACLVAGGSQTVDVSDALLACAQVAILFSDFRSQTFPPESRWYFK